MIDVSILVLNNALPASIADTHYVFSTVNKFLTESGKPLTFNIQLVGLSKEVRLKNGLFTITPNDLVEKVDKTNLIVIPSLAGDMISATYLNKGFAPWIADQYKNGAEVASLCSGAFLLAFSGLLKGKQCTTHWAYANEFTYYYPDVELVNEKVITHQNGLYSSGGNNAYWNLLLYLVEKYTNREMAIRIAKFFVIDIDKKNQSPFIIFNGFKDHEDEVIKTVQNLIEQNFTEKHSIDTLAERVHLTRRTFERRFKKATRITVMEYIQRVKVEAAKKQLEIGRKSINDVMYELGYADIPTFRELFKRMAGMTPVDYRNKYNKEVVH
jgi:transcriptional regulator GlxA family with amidase domain